MEKKLGFGAMRLPTLGSMTEIDMETFQQMVDAFMARGYRHFDTSYVYHGGKSETAIREALVRRYPRSDYTLTNKLPITMVEKSEDLRRFFDEQLERCGVEYFDYYWLHALQGTSARHMEEMGGFEFLKQVKAAGQVRHIGFSFHDTADVLDALLTAHPEIEFVQLIVNYVDWMNGGMECRQCFETVVRHGRQVFVMEPLKGGLLANLPEEQAARLRAHTPGASPAAWAFRWLASLEGIHCILSGMSALEQVQDNVSIFDHWEPLDAEEQALLESVRQALVAKAPNACTYCGECRPVCPEDIAIPTYLGLYNDREIFAPVPWQNGYYRAVTAHAGAPEACIECGACEAACPEGVPIIDLLKTIATVF